MNIASELPGQLTPKKIHLVQHFVSSSSQVHSGKFTWSLCCLFSVSPLSIMYIYIFLSWLELAQEQMMLEVAHQILAVLPDDMPNFT